MALTLTDDELQERNDELASKVRAIWSAALEEITATVDSLDLDTLTPDGIIDLEADFRDIIADARTDTEELIDAELMDEINRAIEEVDEITGAPVLGAQAGPADEIFALLSASLLNSLDQAEQEAFQVATKYSEELRRVQIQTLMEGLIEGESVFERGQRLQAAIEKGNIEIPPTWKGSVESYCETVARTSHANAARNSVIARAAVLGIETFQVSIHGAIDSCGPYEGMIVGEGEDARMSLDAIQNTNSHLFKPNCRHRLLPYEPDFATDTMKRAAELSKDRPLPTEEENRKLDNAAAKARRDQSEDGPLVADLEKQKRKERIGA